MPTGRSALPVFGLWVAWVYLLSLVVLRPAADARLPSPRPEVRFVNADEPFEYDVGAGPNGLRSVEAELSRAFDRPIEIPVTAFSVEAVPEGIEPARPGIDFTVDRDAVVFFPANSRRGVLRERGALLDVAVTPHDSATTRRRFRLRLDGTEDVVVAADPQGLRMVDIPAGTQPPRAGIKAGFQDLLVDVDEKELAGHRFVIEAHRPPDEKAELLLSLHRRNGTGAIPVLHFTGTFAAGAREQVIRLNELVSAEDLRRIGAAYDPRPGVDEWYELHLDARPPLVSSSDPCFTTIFSRDRDESATASFRFENASGEPIRRVVPNEPFWVVTELSQPIEVDCPVTPLVNGKALTPGGIIPAGARRSDRLGPYRIDSDPAPDSDEVSVGVLLEPNEGSGGCQGCGGKPGGCATCRGTCKACGAKSERCPECRGNCPKCGGRAGGCAACGYGTGVCGNCGGKPGKCGVCGGSGAGGSGGGGAGGGGGGGGGKSPVVSPPPAPLPNGPAVPGDFMIFLVNNQRLHEPGDVITDKVREAIKNRNAYGQGVIVINDEGRETWLTEKSDPPAADRAFEPFNADQQDLEGQAARVLDTIARKRKNAENPNIRTLVVWPEREFVSAETLDVFKKLAGDGLGPISFLCPDADPERARELAAALKSGTGKAAGGQVTVRSPQSAELVEHIDDVLQVITAKPKDRVNGEETAK